MLNVRDLRYFLAVADRLHFTRAAESLFVTQPALSKQIAGLERNLGARLFVRRHDGVRLTAAGQALVPYAREMTRLEQSAIAEVRRAAARSDRLTIGFWLTPGNALLSRAIETFSASHPDVRLRLRRADWTEYGAGVETGRADVALLWTEHDHQLRGLRSHRLAVEGVLVAVSDTHPLAGRDFVVQSDLAEETMFSIPQDAALNGVGPGGTYEAVTTIDETVEGILNHLGVGLYTPSVAAAHAHPRVVTIPLHDVAPADYQIVWRQEDEDRPEVTDLVRSLVEAWDRTTVRS
jgi:DNA-binding transcriptional LysR family regulator